MKGMELLLEVGASQAKTTVDVCLRRRTFTDMVALWWQKGYPIRAD